MTVLTFPSNPTVGQQYAAPNGIQYVFDGVKWIVETTSSSSAAVTNSTQDRVAPMFVDGDHTGITFTYNAATNVISADVTAVNGDSLINGAHTVTLESNGNITAPAFTIPNAAGTSGQVLKWPSSGTTLAWGSDNNTTDRLTNGANEVVLNADGSLSIGSNSVRISTNGYNTAFANANTVIYTATVSDLGSIRVHATIEGQEVGDTTGYHTQACDMMIVRRISTLGVSTVDSVVYGVIYTGAGPLATLDAQWNAVTSKIEITATPVSTTNNVFVKIYATEVARGD